MIQFLAILCAVLFIFPYTIYPGLLLLWKCFFTKEMIPKERVEDYQPQVTLLIAAYNEEKVIADKIQNSLALNYPASFLEIIIASDGSTDKTNEIVNRFTMEHKNVKLLAFEIREGKANVLNKAIAYCSGEIIFFSDANAIYNHDAIINGIRHFINPRVGCVAGEKRIVQSYGDDIDFKEGFYWKLESLIKSAESKIKTVIGADGALYAIRRKLYEKLPSDTAVDDFLESMLIVKKGYKIIYEPESYSMESSGGSYKREFNRKVRIAAGNYKNLRYLGYFFKPNVISFMFISHKFLRWISPVILLTLTFFFVRLSFSFVIYQFILLLLVMTYLVGFIGILFADVPFFQKKSFSFIAYFYLTVWAQLIGFIRFLKGNQKAAWEKMR